MNSCSLRLYCLMRMLLMMTLILITNLFFFAEGLTIVIMIISTI